MNANSRVSINSLKKVTFSINYQIAYENYSNSIKYYIKYRQINEEIEKLMTGYKEIIKDFQKKIIQLNGNLLKISKNNDKIFYNNDFNNYPLIKKYLKYLNNIFQSQINLFGDQINDLENKNIFKPYNKKDDNFIEYLQQKKNNFQNEEKSMEKIIVEYDAEYDKLMNTFYDAENTIKKFFVQKHKNKDKDKEKKVKNVNIFNDTISNTLNTEEEFYQIYINYKTANKNFFNIYEKNINEIETEILKISNSLYCNINAFSLLLLNNNNDFIKKLIKFREKLNTNEEENLSETEGNPENSVKTNNNKKEINNTDFKFFKNKYLNVFETNYNKEKYKVRAIHETITLDKLKKETKSILNSLNEEFGFETYLEETPLVLTEEDIYEITKTFYGPFQFVDKTEYDLEVEKKKLDLKILINKLLYFGFKKRKLKEYANIVPITDEEVESLSNSLNKRVYRLNFLQKLNNFRGIGTFEIPEREFKIIVSFFKTIIDIICEEKEKDLACSEYILILSQTFFSNKNGEKIYIQKEIKGDKFFKDKDFWMLYIKNAINKEIQKIKDNIIKNKLNIKKITYGSIAFSHILSFGNNMMDLGMPKEVLLEILETLYKEYQLDDEMKKNINQIIEPNSNKK